MGGFFGIASRHDCMGDVFFGVDYHSHLGTRIGGLAAYSSTVGLQRKIHNIENSPFRTKFEHIFDEMEGTSAIGCIGDSDPQPLLIRSHLGAYAICMTGAIKNADDIIKRYLSKSTDHFDAMTGGRVNSTELLASLINQQDDFVSGIKFAQEAIEGSACIVILKDDGAIIAARDRFGRLPVSAGKAEDGYALAFEDFSYQKMGYETVKELGPGEIVSITPDGVEQLAAPGTKKKICAFLWSYYGYPSTSYEGVNVEMMRYRNGSIMACRDQQRGLTEGLDYIGGVPDSGTPHAIGYANKSGIPFARAFIKYTPTWARSFMPTRQSERDRVARMKQIPIRELIQDKNLLFVDDSIVRGTQLQGTVDFLYSNGAKSVHMRSACPPIMYVCKYHSFTRVKSDSELIARRVVTELEGEKGLQHLEEYSDSNTERGISLRKCICDKFNFTSLGFQSLKGVTDAIGLDPCELCTYCWSGKE